MHKFRASRTLQGRRWLMEQRLEAVEQNDVKRLKQLLSCETPLHPNELVNALRSAILQKSDKSAVCIRILLEKGAQPWGTTGAGTPFLVLASSAGCATIVKLLLDAGCKPDQASSSGSITALHKAASCGHRNCALMLLKYGANVNSVDSDGNTPLNRSMQMSQPNVGSILLEHGADTDIPDKRGRCAIHWATMEKTNTDGLRMLLHAGCDVDVQDEHGCSPIMYAIYQDNMAAVQLLLQKCCDLNIQDCEGNSPLLLAADHEGCGCVHAAAARDHQENQFGDSQNDRLPAAEDSLVSINRHSSDETLQRETVTSNANAVSSALLDTEESCDQAGPVLEEPENDSTRKSLLPTENRSQLLVSLLLVAGARPNTQSTQGISPLWRAVYYGCSHTVLILLRYGADPTCSPRPDASHHSGNDVGRRPLQVAVSHGNLAVVQALYWASIAWGGSLTWLPLHLADNSIHDLTRHSHQVALCHTWLLEQWYGLQKEPTESTDTSQKYPEQLTDNCTRNRIIQAWSRRSLKLLCRTIIRHSLRQVKLPDHIQTLPLPALLRNYINLEEFDTINVTATFRNRC